MSTMLVIVMAGLTAGWADAGPVSTLDGGPRVELIATARIAGDMSDKSGLEGVDRSGVSQSLLGGWGSGIDFVAGEAAGTGTLVAICDRGPYDGASSFRCRGQEFALALKRGEDGSYAFSLELTTTRLLQVGEHELVGSLDAFSPTIEMVRFGTDGKTGTYPARLDPESVRIVRHDAGGLLSGQWLVSDEYGPWIDVFGLSEDGTARHTQRLDLPERYRVKTPGETAAAEMPPTNTSGRAPNRGLESLTLSLDGTMLYTMTQSPLIQDGAFDAKGKRFGKHSRLLSIDLASGTTREVVYTMDDPRHSVNELLQWDEGIMLALERDGLRGSRARTRTIYAIRMDDLSSATNVSTLASLPASELPAGVRGVRKQAWLDLLDPAFGLAGDSMPEKIEGLCEGPRLEDGRRTLLVASDNDLLADQASVVWVFAIGEATVLTDTPDASGG